MNTLSVNLQHSIATLAAGKRSQRDIAKLLGIHRETVGRYLRLEASKPAKVPIGSETGCEAKPAKLPAGSEVLAEPKPAKVPAGIFPRSRSQCEAWREQMEPWIKTGLTAQRIYQDLVGDSSRQPIAGFGPTFRIRYQIWLLGVHGLAGGRYIVSYIHPNAATQGPPTSSAVQVNPGGLFANHRKVPVNRVSGATVSGSNGILQNRRKPSKQ